MFWRMVIRTLVKQRKKMIMIAVTVALGISLCAAMMNVMLGIGDKVNRELKIYGANITVLPKDASVLRDLYGLEEGAGVGDEYLLEDDVLKIKEIFWGFNIVDFAPFLEEKVELVGMSDNVGITGTWVEKKTTLKSGEEIDSGMRRLRNWWEIYLEGDWIGQGDHDKVMVGSLLAGRYGIKVGDTIQIKSGNNTKNLKVASVYIDGGVADEKIVTTLKTAQEIKGLEGKISKIEVSALTTPDNDLAKKAAWDPNSLTPTEYETWYCTAYVSAICHQIQEVVTDSVAKPVRQVAESEGEILKKTQLLMILITILSSIGSSLAISNLITASVMERSREIGLIKAIGAFDLWIILPVIVEVLITGIVGGVIGYFSGIGFAQIIGLTVFGSKIELTAMVIPIIILIVLLVIIFGSIPAVMYLLKLKPTEVLHGK